MPAVGTSQTLARFYFAKRLDDFHSLRRKAIRVIHYRESSRMETLKEQVGVKGYACGFEGLIGFINGLLPSNEVIKQALRKTVPRFPDLAVRELVANALIHQDFFVTGDWADGGDIRGPYRDHQSQARRWWIHNASWTCRRAHATRLLASLMRRIGICEERGSGWDKVVLQTEIYQLPAPLAEATEDHTRVVLFAPRPLSRMDKADRVRAVYLHACLRYVNRQHLTNTSLRERFGIEPQNIATASRLIREAVESADDCTL